MQPDTTPDLECKWCGRSMSSHMRAYYFGFDPTGSPAIDRILCSVAAAGKGYHHTEGWTEAEEGEESCVGLIQRAASEAAKAFSDAARERDELRAIMSGDMDDFVVKAQEEAMAKLRARAEKAEAKIGEIAWRAAEVATKLQEAEARAKELEGLYTRQCALTELKDDRAARAEARAKELEATVDNLGDSHDEGCNQGNLCNCTRKVRREIAGAERAAMTTWSKTPPSEPGWYWCRLDGFGLWPVRVREGAVVVPDVQTWRGPDKAEFGPRIPSPEDIEAAKDALRLTIQHFNDEGERYELHDRCRAALAKLEGRS